MSHDIEKTHASGRDSGLPENYHGVKEIITVTIEEDAEPVYNPEEDPSNPLNWSRGKKNMNLSLVLITSSMGYFSSTIYIPASHDIMLYFNTDLTTINATFSIFLLMNGVAPLFWAPLSERVGRRWIYITSMLLYTLCSVICGISENIGMFFVFRILQSCFACAGQAVGSGSISDLCKASERGRMMSYYILSLILGSPVASVLGGYIDQYLGWKWIFFIMAIIGAVLTVAMILLTSESLYRPEQYSLPKPSTLGDRLRGMKFNPFVSLILLKEPDVFLVCLCTGVAFGGYYFFVTVLPSTFSPIYGLTPSQIGLCFIAGGAGNALGTIIIGHFDYRYYIYQKKKNDGVDCKELKLKLLYASVPFVFISALLYGWFIHYRLHWIILLVLLSLNAFGVAFSVTVVTNYLVESNLKVAASVVSASNLVRCFFGMIFSVSAVKIREAMGDGWSYTFIAILAMTLFLVCTPVVIKYGEGWRQKRG